MKKLLFVLTVLLFFLPKVYAATLYGRNVTANWNVASTWSTTGSGGAGDGTVPTASDGVVFDSGYTGSITITAAAVCRSLTTQADATGTLAHNVSVVLSIGDATAGIGNIALSFVAGLTYTLKLCRQRSYSFR